MAVKAVLQFRSQMQPFPHENLRNKRPVTFVHTNLRPFFYNSVIGATTDENSGTNLLYQENVPIILLISLAVVDLGNSSVAVTFSGSTFNPLRSTMYPRYFISWRQNWHLSQLTVMLAFLRRLILFPKRTEDLNHNNYIV